MRDKRSILFVVPHRSGRSPGQRFRFEQYFDLLEQNNFDIEISNLLSEWDDKHFYRKGNLTIKLFILAKSWFKRLNDLKRAKKFDFVFIYREAFMTGSTFFEKKITKRCKHTILDFDDSIWLMDISRGNEKLKFIKNPEKTIEILKMVSKVSVGNKHLKNYASKYNKNVFIIPTTIDLEYHKNTHERENKKALCIGWTGTSTTLKHLQFLLPVLHGVRKKYLDKVSFMVIADDEFDDEGLNIKFVKWNKEDEIEQLSKIDIGIMPLPDNEWTRGKCGFKGLQYMSLGIPTIMSPVGVNKEIIIHHKNGFLAQTKEEWIEALSQLIEHKDLRDKLGEEGQATIKESYSTSANAQKYLDLFTA